MKGHLSKYNHSETVVELRLQHMNFNPQIVTFSKVMAGQSCQHSSIPGKLQVNAHWTVAAFGLDCLYSLFWNVLLCSC